MAPSAAPTTVTAAWAGPFNAETPFGTIEPGAEVEIPYEQACGGHWVNPQTGEPFEPIEQSPAAVAGEPVETVGEDVTATDVAGEQPGEQVAGQTLTADDAGVSTGEEPI